MSTLKTLVRTLMPRSVRPHRIRGGPLRGQRIVTSWHDYPAAILGTTEAALLSWFDTNVKSGETWLDVGAHYGYTSMALCRLVGTTGRVFAFEPVLRTVGYLESTKHLNRLHQLTVVPFALGAAEPIALAASSIERGMATHSDSPDAYTTQFFVVALDSLWASINGNQPRIDGIKIDVQGMEHMTIRGMLGTLREWRPKLIVEFHRGVDRDQLVSTLAGVGYEDTGHPIDSDAVEKNYDDRSFLFVPETAS